MYCQMLSSEVVIFNSPRKKADFQLSESEKYLRKYSFQLLIGIIKSNEIYSFDSILFSLVYII